MINFLKKKIKYMHFNLIKKLLEILKTKFICKTIELITITTLKLYRLKLLMILFVYKILYVIHMYEVWRNVQ